MGDGSKRCDTGIDWLVREETMRFYGDDGYSGRATSLDVWVKVEETGSAVACTRENISRWFMVGVISSL